MNTFNRDDSDRSAVDMRLSESKYIDKNFAMPYADVKAQSLTSASQLNDSSLRFDKPHVINVRVNKKVTVFDVAAYIIKKQGPMSSMKLQKLSYYCQAWSLVWDEAPLFPDRIEAWANGPVIPELFSYHRGQFIVSEILIGNIDNLSKKQRETIDAVLDFYGDKQAQWLIDLSHSEKPWQLARNGLTEHEYSNREISIESIAEYYSSISK